MHNEDNFMQNTASCADVEHAELCEEDAECYA